MLRIECRKRIANFRNDGLKNQESFEDVEGSEKSWKWKRIALPKLPLLWNTTFGGLLAAFRGVRSFCVLPKPIDKPHRSAGATQTPLPGWNRSASRWNHTMMIISAGGGGLSSAALVGLAGGGPGTSGNAAGTRTVNLKLSLTTLLNLKRQESVQSVDWKTDWV
jgi:hypothetical protein